MKNRIDEAERRVRTVDPFEVNCEKLAEQVCEDVEGETTEEYVKAYIQDRMWYRRGV